MKKNVIIGLLTIVSLMSVTYVFYWKAEADRLYELLREQARIAAENQDETIKQKAIVEQQAKLIEEQRKVIESMTRGTK